MIRVDNYKRVFNTPVGSIGNVADARQPVEHNVVFVGDFTQAVEYLFAFAAGFAKAAVKIADGLLCAFYQLLDHLVVVAPFLNFAEAMAHFFNQRLLAVLVFEQVVNQVRIADNCPDISEYFKQHSC